MIDIAVICIGAFCSLLGLLNGVYMLASPRAWFRLPGWLRASGSLSEGKYSSGWGALQVRFLGGLIVAFFVMMFGSIIYDEFIRASLDHSPSDGLLGSLLRSWHSTITWLLIAALAPLTLINGLVMVVSPSAWDDLPKWLKVAGVPDSSEAFRLRHVYIRLVGAVILVCVVWVLYAITVNW